MVLLVNSLIAHVRSGRYMSLLIFVVDESEKEKNDVSCLCFIIRLCFIINHLNGSFEMDV